MPPSGKWARMRNDLECPACLKMFDYDGDHEGFNQDSEQEFDCPRCETTFLATVYWDLCFTSERLNPTPTSPSGADEL